MSTVDAFKFSPDTNKVVLRFSLTPSDVKISDIKLKKVNSIFLENGLFLNVPELLRAILLNIDDEIILNHIINSYALDCPASFKFRKTHKQG